MERQVQETLCAAGVDVQDGLRRVSGSEMLYLRLLVKFLQDKSYPCFLEAMENTQLGDAANAVHALKGVCANLGMTELYEQCIQAEKQLKNDETPQNMEIIQKCFERVQKAILTIKIT